MLAKSLHLPKTGQLHYSSSKMVLGKQRVGSKEVDKQILAHTVTHIHPFKFIQVA